MCECHIFTSNPHLTPKGSKRAVGKILQGNKPLALDYIVNWSFEGFGTMASKKAAHVWLASFFWMLFHCSNSLHWYMGHLRSTFLIDQMDLSWICALGRADWLDLVYYHRIGERMRERERLERIERERERERESVWPQRLSPPGVDFVNNWITSSNDPSRYAPLRGQGGDLHTPAGGRGRGYHFWSTFETLWNTFGALFSLPCRGLRHLGTRKVSDHFQGEKSPNMFNAHFTTIVFAHLHFKTQQLSP